MSMKRTMMVAALAAILGGTSFCSSAYAAVSVTDVKAVQRYPWNGMVDIDYTVVCDDANADVYVFPEGTDNDTGALLQLKTLTGEGANGAVKAGTHRMTWNAAKDMPNFHSSSFSVKMTAISGAAPYIVIDLSGGANATNYPVRFSAAGPNLDDDTCRTTELWLRLILPGTFTMGDSRNGGSWYTSHEVTISKPFYLGIFEMTQKQYQLVTGSNPSSYPGDARPVESLSYNDIRGSLVGANWPSHGQVDADSFLGKIRARTALNLDLPTEAQWEYACRAGTTTTFNNGKDRYTDPDSAVEIGRYTNNCFDGRGGYSQHTKVGSYQPNAWGLYDTCGNVAELSLDWSGAYPNYAVVDPVGPTNGELRSCRGGSWGQSYIGSDTRESPYPGGYPDSRSDCMGFRLCCSAGQ